MHESIDRNIVILGWVGFFTDIASAMINPILPIFAITILHEGYDKLGAIVAIATFLSYALRLGKGVRSAPKDLPIASYAKEKAADRTFGFHKTLDIAGELGGTLLLFGALFLFGQNENTMRTLFFGHAGPRPYRSGTGSLFLSKMWLKKRIRKYRNSN